jgi:hypothetical protein
VTLSLNAKTIESVGDSESGAGEAWRVMTGKYLDFSFYLILKVVTAMCVLIKVVTEVIKMR